MTGLTSLVNEVLGNVGFKSIIETSRQEIQNKADKIQLKIVNGQNSVTKTLSDIIQQPYKDNYFNIQVYDGVLIVSVSRSCNDCSCPHDVYLENYDGHVLMVYDINNNGINWGIAATNRHDSAIGMALFRVPGSNEKHIIKTCGCWSSSGCAMQGYIQVFFLGEGGEQQ